MIVEKIGSIQMVLTDLDGTLLNNDKEIGNLDYQTLELLGKMRITRVVATGRNLYSVYKVLKADSPFDYLIFSSGAGILDWKTKKILFQSSISNHSVIEIENTLKRLKLNFSIHFPIPENHKYYYFKGNSSNTDFDYRNKIHNAYNFELTCNYPLELATQFVIILNDESEIKGIVDHLNGFKAIRATSPIDGKSVWLEIFNTDVSKALGGKFLCDMLDVSPKNTIGIGNDFNDLDMLNWVSHSFMVSNAPEILKLNHRQCVDNQNNPLTDVISKFLA